MARDNAETVTEERKPATSQNWRPIALLDVLSKILSSFIARRLDRHDQKSVSRNKQVFLPTATLPTEFLHWKLPSKTAKNQNFF
jgi:hypothetical protein